MQKQIFHTFSILDMTNFSLKSVNKRVYSIIKKTSNTAQSNYPEQLAMMIIVKYPPGSIGAFS